MLTPYGIQTYIGDLGGSLSIQFLQNSPGTRRTVQINGKLQAAGGVEGVIVSKKSGTGVYKIITGTQTGIAAGD